MKMQRLLVYSIMIYAVSSTITWAMDYEYEFLREQLEELREERKKIEQEKAEPKTWGNIKELAARRARQCSSKPIEHGNTERELRIRYEKVNRQLREIDEEIKKIESGIAQQVKKSEKQTKTGPDILTKRLIELKNSLNALVGELS